MDHAGNHTCRHSDSKKYLHTAFITDVQNILFFVIFLLTF